MGVFDKELFAQLLTRAKGDRSLNQFETDCGVSAAHLSRLSRGLLKTPPNPDTIQKIAAHAHNGVSYYDLMDAAGHLTKDEIGDPSPTRATPADQKTVEAERRIDEALAEDADHDFHELQEFWNELKKRPDLFLLFKQVRPMSNDSIRRAIRLIKAIEEEEAEERNR